VLLVEDESAYAVLVEAFLRDAVSSPFELTHEKRLQPALARLAAEAPDVILLDLTLPDSQGLDTCRQVKAAAPAVPVIVLTGNDDEKVAVQAVREGAQDYLVKGQFDGRTLVRVVRYAIERKHAHDALQRSEEFFRLISENVSDLIAVLGPDGRRLYNSPSYGALLGDPDRLLGTSSFEEIHAEDRPRIQHLFKETFVTGVGHRAEYRLVRPDGAVRHIESVGSPIRDEQGRTCKVVVVSRDITERREAVEVLRQALTDVKRSHEQLQTTQRQLVDAERHEAVSTFAAGVAHEVKNPLQTIILGVDYLSHHVPADDATSTMVLGDMGAAVQRADSILRGLMELSGHRKRAPQPADLTEVVEQALRVVEVDLVNYPVQLSKNLATGLPPVLLDPRTMKHVFINLLLYAARAMPEGGRLVVKTHTQALAEIAAPSLRRPAAFKPGDAMVVAEVEQRRNPSLDPPAGAPPEAASVPRPGAVADSLGVTVLRKIIELYSGSIEVAASPATGTKYTVRFKAQKPLPP
jgi:PAS domain S-box-containing protein